MMERIEKKREEREREKKMNCITDKETDEKGK